jgi:hypothetical protein
VRTSSIAAVKTGFNGWDPPLFSIKPITKLTYFQLKINHLEDHTHYFVPATGIFIGVSRSNTVDTYAYAGRNVICIYNSELDSDKNHDTWHISCTASAGDVIGVVIDLKEDQVRFYVNAKFVGVGTRRPSAYQTLYAVLWLFYHDCDVELGEYFPYETLQK